MAKAKRFKFKHRTLGTVREMTKHQYSKAVKAANKAGGKCLFEPIEEIK